MEVNRLIWRLKGWVGKNVGAENIHSRIKTNSGIKHLLFDLQELNDKLVFLSLFFLTYIASMWIFL